jgi:hypothetical protein
VSQVTGEKSREEIGVIMLKVIERNGVKLFVDIESGSEQDEMPDLWVRGTLWGISWCDRYHLTCG